MVSKGQFVGLDWNRIARLHSQLQDKKKIEECVLGGFNP